MTRDGYPSTEPGWPVAAPCGHWYEVLMHPQYVEATKKNHQTILDLEQRIYELENPKKKEGEVGTWSHCGDRNPHSSHTHTIVFNEGPYPGVVCLGTPE